ncbi:unnamed protein product [Symbiodinium sp. CCMP2456]|nr:unnamed protein product [Symbiodinium sp. CCMP2456]
MQSHSFAVQSSERLQQHRKTAEAAVKDATDAVTTAQEELRVSGKEVEDVVERAEDFLKRNLDHLPQDKAQPLAALCTRFKQFAEQLNVRQDGPPKPMPMSMTTPMMTQESAMQGLLAMQQKTAAAGLMPGMPGMMPMSMHPLPDFQQRPDIQQRVMIVGEDSKPKEEDQPDGLFGEEDHDLQSTAAFNPFPESGQEDEISREEPAAVETSPEAAAEKKQEDLAAYKNRLLSEASYLQAVFGGKKDFLKLASSKNGLIYPVEEERRTLGQDKSIDKYLKE